MRRWLCGVAALLAACGDDANTGGSGASGAAGGGPAAGGGGGVEGGAPAAGGGGGIEGGGGAAALELGSECDRGSACASGFCVDGVCCDTACGAACDACVEAISGSFDGTCAPAAAGTMCRAAAGTCDVAESCDGSALDCPADVIAPAKTECRPSEGDCDPGESCDGSSPECPTDLVADLGTVCRPAAGDCDLDEECDGANAACPDDDVDAAGTLCRVSAGPCDLEEQCDGVAASCGADVFASAGDLCRAAVGPCDLEELCTGGEPACPVDALAPAGAAVSSCDPYVCSGGPMCGATCAEDEDCAAGNLCVESQCRPARRVFVTSTTHLGSLGGIAGGDAICAARAQAAGLPGTYKAWLSVSGTTPVTTFVNSSIPWVRLDGVKVADDFADLTDTTIDAPIVVTELGANLGSGYLPVWTGTNSLGNQQGVNCSAWTTSSAQFGGWYGNASVSSFEWTSMNYLNCGTPIRLYCFEQ
jgi:hypothetical protein